MVAQISRSFGLCAVCAAEEPPARLDAVTDDVTVTVLAARRESLDGTLEAVEDVVGPGRDHLEDLSYSFPQTSH